MKKYRLTDETIEVDGHTLHRIEAVRDFWNVKAGDKGGFVESESNLSHEDDCWIYDYAKVYGNASVYENARVLGSAEVYDYAEVFGDAFVCNRACVYEYAHVFGRAEVYDYACIYGSARVYDSTRAYDNTSVYGNTHVYGNAVLTGDAKVKSKTDYIVFKNWWSCGRYFTWTRSNNMWKVGCFYCTGEELIKKAYRDSELSGREYERVVRYVESILADNENKPSENNQ